MIENPAEQQSVDLHFAFFDSAFHTSDGLHWAWYSDQLDTDLLMKFYFSVIAEELRDLPTENPSTHVRCGVASLGEDWVCWFKLYDGGRDQRGRPGRFLMLAGFIPRGQAVGIDTSWMFELAEFEEVAASAMQPSVPPFANLTRSVVPRRIQPDMARLVSLREANDQRELSPIVAMGMAQACSESNDVKAWRCIEYASPNRARVAAVFAESLKPAQVKEQQSPVQEVPVLAQAIKPILDPFKRPPARKKSRFKFFLLGFVSLAVIFVAGIAIVAKSKKDLATETPPEVITEPKEETDPDKVAYTGQIPVDSPAPNTPDGEKTRETDVQEPDGKQPSDVQRTRKKLAESKVNKLAETMKQALKFQDDLPSLLSDSEEAKKFIQFHKDFQANRKQWKSESEKNEFGQIERILSKCKQDIEAKHKQELTEALVSYNTEVDRLKGMPLDAIPESELQDLKTKITTAKDSYPLATENHADTVLNEIQSLLGQSLSFKKLLESTSLKSYHEALSNFVSNYQSENTLAKEMGKALQNDEVWSQAEKFSTLCEGIATSFKNAQLTPEKARDLQSELDTLNKVLRFKGNELRTSFAGIWAFLDDVAKQDATQKEAAASAQETNDKPLPKEASLIIDFIGGTTRKGGTVTYWQRIGFEKKSGHVYGLLATPDSNATNLVKYGELKDGTLEPGPEATSFPVGAPLLLLKSNAQRKK